MNHRQNSASFRHPSAMIPIAMSLAALAIVLTSVAIGGARPGSDEGTAAHLFQILLAGQAPIIAFFAARWLPRDPPCALQILGVQALAAGLALLPVILLGL